MTKDSKMFKALDKVQYDTLKLNQPKKEPEKPAKFKVKSLLEIACMTLNWHAPILYEGVSVLPVHLVPRLLQIAITSNQAWAVSTIVSNWPMDTLRFADILTEDEVELFEEEMGMVCFYVFEGITNITDTCRLRCLDFRDMNLNSSFCKLIIQTWPLLSLKKSQLNPKKLAKVIAETSGINKDKLKLKDQLKLTSEVIPKILLERLSQDIIKNADRIILPKGHRLEVKIDGVHFTTSKMFFMDYMISNCLRAITPVFVTVSNLYIKSELLDGDAVTDSLAPFLVLRGQDTDVLEGLSLRQLEEGILFLVCPDIQRFTNLHSLDMQDCNIYLQEGITRSRTALRSRLCSVLGAFNHLHRLDIGFNYLVGCLEELLDSLKKPLDYLSLRGCDLNEHDLTYLSKSKHAVHLRELNLSRVCHMSIYESDRFSPSHLLKILKHFPKLTVLNLSQNPLGLPNSWGKEFCETLANHLSCLKALDIGGNLMHFDYQVEVVKACTQIPSMQWIRLTCTNNVSNGGLYVGAAIEQLDNMADKLKEVVKAHGRDDIFVEVVRLSFAILVDLIDFL